MIEGAGDRTCEALVVGGGGVGFDLGVVADALGSLPRTSLGGWMPSPPHRPWCHVADVVGSARGGRLVSAIECFC